MGNRPEWVVSSFAVAMAGGVLVPISTFAEPPELDYILRHSGTSILLMQDALAGHAYLEDLYGLAPGLRSCAPGRIRCPEFPDLRTACCVGVDAVDGPVQPWAALERASADVDERHLDACAAQVSPGDDGLVVYTSGTTAAPKAVLHAQRSPALQSWRSARILGLDSTVRAWGAMPLFWTAGFCRVMGATVACGGSLVLQEVFEPGEALRLLEVERVTTPHVWLHQEAQLEDHPDWKVRDLSSLRHVEALGSFSRHKTVQVDEPWSALHAYGTSETFTIVTADPASGSASSPDDSHHGRILPGNCIRIVDVDTGAPLPVGMDGEIAVKGPTLMKGYLKTAVEDCFDDDGFFRTGDSGFVDGEGRLHWTGRITGLMKTGGANVSPVEIEEALYRHPGLKVALAVGVPDPVLGEIVVVCAVAHDGASVDEADVRAFLKGKLASYKVPRRVLFFEESDLSMTGSAKVRGEPLRALATARLAGEPAPP
jgi:acyl-CoA synthetase (AMP-forming)/AMP-acid ligase II